MDLDFLQSYKNKHLIPKSLQFRVANKRLGSSETYFSCQRCLLNQETFLLAIFTSVPAFPKSNSYQSIIHACKKFVIIKKERQVPFPQIHVQPTGLLPLSRSNRKVKISALKILLRF